MTASAPDRPDDHPRKSLLICPECGHRSVPDGDWRVIQRPNTTVLECPTCTTEIARRPIYRNSPLVPAMSTMPAMVTSMWNGYLRGVGRLFRS